MVTMGIWQELSPKEVGNRTYFPPPCYTLSKKEKKKFLQLFVGYQSSPMVLIKCEETCVREWSQINWLKISWLSCLDATTSTSGYPWHLTKKCKGDYNQIVLILQCYMQQSYRSWKFRWIRTRSVNYLVPVRDVFPPSFFDIMVHLVVHIVREIRICGPVYLWWMYLAESYMNIFKGYTKNHHNPEALIVERYIIEEAIDICTNYLSDANFVGVLDIVMMDLIQVEVFMV